MGRTRGERRAVGRGRRLKRSVDQKAVVSEHNLSMDHVEPVPIGDIDATRTGRERQLTTTTFNSSARCGRRGWAHAGVCGAAPKGGLEQCNSGRRKMMVGRRQASWRCTGIAHSALVAGAGERGGKDLGEERPAKWA
jgi:hypothetical protein